MKQRKPYGNCFEKVLKPKSTDRPFMYNLIVFFWGGGGGAGGGGETDEGYTKCNKCAINGVK